MRRPAVLLAALLFLIAASGRFVDVTFGSGTPDPPRVDPAAADAVDGARLVLVDSIPVARFSGTPYEMGLQHGRVFREQIEFLRREFYEALVVAVLGRKNIDEWLDRVEPHLPQRYKDELRGLGEGAGIGYREALAFNAGIDLLQSTFCSTVFAAGEASADGEVYFGRNLDFAGRGVLHKTSVVVVFVPDDGPEIAAVTWPGLIGVLSGMNEHGVAGATMMIHQGGSPAAGMPYTIMYRDALYHARRAADVYDVIAKTPRTCSNNFMVVDAEGAAEVIEFTPTRIARRAPESGAMCSTNFFATKDLAGEEFLPVGRDRYAALQDFLTEQRGKIDLDGVHAALKEVATPWHLNVQAMVFLPRRREISMSVGGALPAAAQRFVPIGKDVLFPR